MKRYGLTVNIVQGFRRSMDEGIDGVWGTIGFQTTIKAKLRVSIVSQSFGKLGGSPVTDTAKRTYNTILLKGNRINC